MFFCKTLIHDYNICEVWIFWELRNKMKGDETVNEFKKQFGRSWWVIRRKFIVGKNILFCITMYLHALEDYMDYCQK